MNERLIMITYSNSNKKQKRQVQDIIDQGILWCSTAMVTHMLSEGQAGFEYDNVENWDENRDILEWYMVSPYLFDWLKQFNEPVLATDYGYYWGRTTSGQALIQDEVFWKIYNDKVNN